jgi:hypothetical protein
MIFTSLYEFDLRTGKTQRLCNLAELDPALRDLHTHTGYDALDPPRGGFISQASMGNPISPSF